MRHIQICVDEFLALIRQSVVFRVGEDPLEFGFLEKFRKDEAGAEVLRSEYLVTHQREEVVDREEKVHCLFFAGLEILGRDCQYNVDTNKGENISYHNEDRSQNDEDFSSLPAAKNDEKHECTYYESETNFK